MEMQDAMAFLSALQILHQSGSRAPLPLALPPATMNQQQLQAVADVNELMLLSAAQYPGALHLGVPFPPFGLPPRASPMPPAFAPPTTTQTAAPTSASSAPSPTVVAAAAPGPKHQSQATAKRSRRVSMTTSSASRMSSPKTTSHSKMDINFLTTPSPCPDHSFDFGAVAEWSSPLSSPRSPRLDRSCGEESPLPPSPPAATEAGRVDHHQAGDRVVQLAAEEAKERWREREESMVSLKHTHKAIAANRMAQHNQNQKRRRTDQPSSSSSSGSSGSSQEDEDEESDGGHDAAGGGREPRVMSGRTCMHCGITSTPEWRTGPDGKGTLCNACGLRYRKFVRAEEKRGVVIAFPAMPALAKPRKRRRPAGEQSGEADRGTESVLMDTTKQDNRDHATRNRRRSERRRQLTPPGQPSSCDQL